MSDSPRRKPLVRFSIAALLFLMLCLGGYLAGYRAGYDVGKQASNMKTYIRKVYPVGDLIGSRPDGTVSAADFDNLIDLLLTTVSSDSWMESGTGEGELQPFPTNKSLVISQTQFHHEKIANFLEGLRKLKPSSGSIPE
jgi:hypothetical protein